MKTTYICDVPLPIDGNTTGKILPGMSGTDALISVGKIADNGYDLLFTDKNCLVYPKGIINYNISDATMQAPRNPQSDLYEYKITQKSFANALKRYMHNISNANHVEITKFWSAVFCNPTDQTFYNAVKDLKDINIPGLTHDMIRKNMPHSIETDAGHMRLKPSNISPSKRYAEKKLRAVLIEKKKLFDSYSDLAGIFPEISADGNQYILVLIHYTDYIFIRALKDRHGTEQAKAYDSILQECKEKNMVPTTYMMDNEISPEVKAVLNKYKVNIEINHKMINLATPHNKRANRAERIMNIVKPVIIGAIAGTNRDFPIKLWDKLLPQCEIVMNLLRPSFKDANISCYGAFYGAYDFMKHPMAPPGVMVMYYHHAKERTSWGHRSKMGFYVGPALFHFQCFTVVDKITKKAHVTDTLAFHPERVIMPGSNKIELLTSALKQLTDILKYKNDPKNEDHIQSNQLIESLLQYQKLYQPTEQIKTDVPRLSVGTNTDIIDEIDESPRVITIDEIPNMVTNDEIPRVVTIDEIPRVVTNDEIPKVDIPEIINDLNRVEEASYKYNEQELKNKSLDTTKEICHLHGIRVRKNSIQSTLIKEILRIQGQTKIKSADDNKKKKKAKVAKSSTIIGMDVLNKLPKPTVPQVFQKEYWHDVKTTRKLKKSSWGWKNEYKAAAAIENQFTYRDHTKPKYNYRKEKKANKEMVELQEDKEITYFIDNSCIKEHLGKLPDNCKPTYYNPQLEYKIDQNSELLAKIRGAAGGDHVESEYENVSRATEPILVKAFLNAAVSENAYIMTIDLGKFFLHEQLPPEDKIFMKMTEEQIPDMTMKKHKLQWRVDKNGKRYVIFQCLKAIYGLPQANYLAYQGLKKNLTKHGYYETGTKCLFRHESNGISFIVHVDDFAVKFKNLQDAKSLVKTLEECGYTVKANIPCIDNQENSRNNTPSSIQVLHANMILSKDTLMFHCQIMKNF